MSSFLQTIMAKAKPPSYGSIKSAHRAAVPVKASMDSANVPPISPEHAPAARYPKIRTAICICVVLLSTFYLNVIARDSSCSSPAVLESPSYLTGWCLVCSISQLLVLALAGFPASDVAPSHGFAYFLYQIMVFLSFAYTPCPPSNFVMVFLTFVVSSVTFHTAVIAFGYDLSETGSYGLFVRGLEDILLISVGARPKKGVIKPSSQNCIGRINTDRSTTNTQLSRGKPSQSPSLRVENMV